MRNPHGYTVFFSPDSAPVERDSIRCNHCQRVEFVEPGLILRHPEGWSHCRACDAAICGGCTSERSCVTWEARLAKQERRAALIRQIVGE